MKSIAKRLILILFLSLSSCRSFLPSEIRALEHLEIFSLSERKNAIILDGVINSSALIKFKALHQEYKHIKHLIIINCDGSINDVVNLELSKYIYQNGFDIHLKDNGIIASGGTDLFLAGHKRTKGNNTKIGVHSWAGISKTATDFPKGHAEHLPYINYYKSVGFSTQEAEAFYYFTINSAPAEDIHWMTDSELEKYKVLNH
ncbi:MAG: hypothetical protein HRT67_09440 [Flavobacteriaceae bacterium]|nr:hypothetical protein [Flavobacteriaceae bacterium]